MILFDILTLYFHSLHPFTVIRFVSGMGGGAAQAAVAAAIARLAHSDKGCGIYLPMLAITRLVVLPTPSRST